MRRSWGVNSPFFNDDGRRVNGPPFRHDWRRGRGRGFFTDFFNPILYKPAILPHPFVDSVTSAVGVIPLRLTSINSPAVLRPVLHGLLGFRCLSGCSFRNLREGSADDSADDAPDDSAAPRIVPVDNGARDSARRSAHRRSIICSFRGRLHGSTTGGQ